MTSRTARRPDPGPPQILTGAGRTPPPHGRGPSRRTLLAGAAGLLPLGLAGCGSEPTISTDPDELVMWFWDRSASPKLLEQAAKEIPGTSKHLRADVIGTSFDTKLRTSLAGNAYIPDITYINSNNALYFTNEDLFLDLSELGADSVKDDFYEWKWNLGMTPTGRFCFFPLDIGPTGYFYRYDVFEKAGLPTSPEDVSSAIATWKDWIDVGVELKGGADAFMVNDAQTVYEAVLNSSPERYFDTADKALYAQDGSAVRQAWDTAVSAIEVGVTARIPRERGTDQNAAWASGRTAGNVGAAWWTQVLQESAPDTAGAWRLASQPVRPGNSGGSFAALPHSCKDPEAALAFITWINSPENQALAYEDVQLFPSTPGSFEDLSYSGDFYGDQDPLAFFSTAAESVPSSFISTWETVVGGFFTFEITNIETAGKDPEQAWQDALTAADRALTKRGVES